MMSLSNVNAINDASSANIAPWLHAHVIIPRPRPNSPPRDLLLPLRPFIINYRGLQVKY